MRRVAQPAEHRTFNSVVEGSKPSVPSKCPKCGTELERREKMFHWRGTFLPGDVCVPCNALYQIDNNFFDHVRDHQ